jgi:DUF4097 and DUF4098 domain-containing protein YvlB
LEKKNMKSKWITVVIVLLALLAVCAAIVAIGAIFFLAPIRVGGIQLGSTQILNVTAEATEQQSFQVEGPAALDLENVFGDVQITAATDETQKEIQVTAHKVAWGSNQGAAEAALEELKVIMTQEGDRLTVKVEFPELVNRLRDKNGYQVDFTIVAPVETTVLAHTSSGEMSLAGTQGSADISSNFGEVRATGLAGALKASSNSGRITAQDIQAGAGRIELGSDFGAVTLKNAAAGNVTAHTSSGSVELTSVTAGSELEATTDYGGITIRTGKAGSLNATTSSGAVELVDLQVTGSLTAHSSFGDIRLTKAFGATYDLSTDSGSVTVDGTRGTLKASSGFGSIEVTHGDLANIDLETNSGKVYYQGSLGDGPHRLSSDFGDIRLVLPDGSAFTFDLETGFGSIDSDFPIAIDGKPAEKHWQGTVNGGGCSLDATTQSGSITIEQLSQ